MDLTKLYMLILSGFIGIILMIWYTSKNRKKPESNYKSCPRCAEKIPKGSKMCIFCKYDMN